MLIVSTISACFLFIQLKYIFFEKLSMVIKSECSSKFSNEVVHTINTQRGEYLQVHEKDTFNATWGSRKAIENFIGRFAS